MTVPALAVIDVTQAWGMHSFLVLGRLWCAWCPIGFLGDAVPAMDFYLGRVVPEVAAEKAALDGLLSGGRPLWLIAQDPKDPGKLGPGGTRLLGLRDIDGDPRFRLVRESAPGEMPLRLYRGEGPP